MSDAGLSRNYGAGRPDLVPRYDRTLWGETARMHAKPEYGVVDAWNRVYGAPNVLVCDAACFTTRLRKKKPNPDRYGRLQRAPATRLAHDLKHA